MYTLVLKINSYKKRERRSNIVNLNIPIRIYFYDNYNNTLMRRI